MNSEDEPLCEESEEPATLLELEKEKPEFVTGMTHYPMKPAEPAEEVTAEEGRLESERILRMKELDGLEPGELMQRLVEIIYSMGWNIAIPKLGDDEEVPGFIVGNGSYVDLILSHLPDNLLTKDRRPEVEWKPGES